MNPKVSPYDYLIKTIGASILTQSSEILIKIRIYMYVFFKLEFSKDLS